MRAFDTIQISLLAVKENPSTIPIIICDSQSIVRYKTHFLALPEEGEVITNYLTKSQKKRLDGLFLSKTGAASVTLCFSDCTIPCLMLYNKYERSTIWLLHNSESSSAYHSLAKNILHSVDELSFKIIPEFYLFKNHLSLPNEGLSESHDNLNKHSSNESRLTSPDALGVDCVSYIVARFMKHSLKQNDAHVSAAGLLSYTENEKFKNVREPFLFSAVFMSVLSMICKNHQEKVSIGSLCGDDDFTLQATIKPEVHVPECNELVCLADTLFLPLRDAMLFDKIVRDHNWKFSISPSDDDKITVKLTTNTVRIPELLADISRHSLLVAYAEFLEYLGN